MVRHSEVYPFLSGCHQPVLGRFACVLDYTTSGQSVESPTVRYPGSVGHDLEGCDEILPCDIYGAFRLRHDPPTC